jgi:UDP-glucose 4-epimerase
MIDRYVLVTGGAGFIDNHLVVGLIYHGVDVWVFDNLNNGRLSGMNLEMENSSQMT